MLVFCALLSEESGAAPIGRSCTRSLLKDWGFRAGGVEVAVAGRMGPERVCVGETGVVGMSDEFTTEGRIWRRTLAQEEMVGGSS